MSNVDWQAARQSPPTELDTTISTSCNLSITAPQVGQYMSLLQLHVKHRRHHHSGAHQCQARYCFFFCDVFKCKTTKSLILPQYLQCTLDRTEFSIGLLPYLPDPSLSNKMRQFCSHPCLLACRSPVARR